MTHREHKCSQSQQKAKKPAKRGTRITKREPTWERQEDSRSGSRFNRVEARRPFPGLDLVPRAQNRDLPLRPDLNHRLRRSLELRNQRWIQTMKPEMDPNNESKCSYCNILLVLLLVFAVVGGAVSIWYLTRQKTTAVHDIPESPKVLDKTAGEVSYVVIR